MKHIIDEVDKKIDNAKRGVADGVASLDANGLVPLNQLPAGSGSGSGGGVSQTYVDNADALKANNNSPILTGTPQAPTPFFTSVSEEIATTRFVSNSLRNQQTPFVVIRPDGVTKYFADWGFNSVDCPTGSQIRLRGSYGNPNSLYVFPSYCTLYLEAGAVFSFNRLVPQTIFPFVAGNKITLTGSGTYKGSIFSYSDYPSIIDIKGIIHDGQLVIESIGNNDVKHVINVHDIIGKPLAGYSYIVTDYKNGDNSSGYFKISVYNSKITVSGVGPANPPFGFSAVTGKPASIFELNVLNHTAGSNNIVDKENNILDIINCSFTGDGTNPVYSALGDYVTKHFANNNTHGIIEPFPISDVGIKAFGVDVGNGGANNITAQQILNLIDTVNSNVSVAILNGKLTFNASGSGGSTQPASPTIVSQTDNNEGGSFVYAANSTHPGFSDYEYRTQVVGMPFSAWTPCQSFTIQLENEEYIAGGVEVRVAADSESGTLAGIKLVSTIAYTQFLYPIMLRMPTYSNGVLTVTTRNDGDGNTGIFVDNLDRIGYVTGNTNQYLTAMFNITLAPGQHTIYANDGRGTYTTPTRTFTVS